MSKEVKETRKNDGNRKVNSAKAQNVQKAKKEKLTGKRRREAAIKEAKRRKKIKIACAVAIPVVLAAIIVPIVLWNLKYNFKSTFDYSKGLNDDGTIAGIDVSEYVKLPDMNAQNMTRDDFRPTDEEVQKYIDTVIAQHPDYSEEEGRVIKDGDAVNLAFELKVDGKPVEGGSTEGKGTIVNAGAGEYPGDFDKKIIGHKVGEKFDVDTVYPEDYANVELAGKNVTFSVDVFGVYFLSEFNDEFVKKNFEGITGTSDFIEKYKESVADTYYVKNIMNVVSENAEVIKYPAAYKKDLMRLYKGKEEKAFLATATAGAENGKSGSVEARILESKKMNKKQYTEYLEKQAEAELKEALVMQAMYEKYNLSVSDEDIDAILASYAYKEDEMDKLIDRFGTPYVNRLGIKNAVQRYLSRE
ncbi:MAG: FKBP-type peptidyl-prolyl cis-trans isomerase [Lachnospiraceae bacterium]|nr:FKBP-type peptidyl-prolyl cis-trans isomerase [Lachnospiraceae bacterium]